MSPAVYLHGRGLVSALGADLPSALACLATGGVEPARLCGPGGTPAWPYFAIDDADTDWLARAERLIRQAVSECAAADRNAPLFLASCSIHIGAIEDELTLHGDCLDFADRVASWLDWRGPVHWLSTACTSASNALLAAAACLRSGESPHALVLGIELRNRFTCGGFAAMQLLDSVRPRPLAADRAGLVLGEAIAALWLDTAPARWRLAGGANVIDGHDPAGASAEAVEAMLRRTLASAALAPDAIGLIKLQAAGSPASDAAELSGLRAVFGQLPALTTLKAEMGHTLGASGAAELALLCSCLESGIWPAPRTAADPALDARLCDEAPAARYLLANILGFGGGHATVILEDCA